MNYNIDRIVEINNIKLIVTHRMDPNRRNLVCESNKLLKYINTNNIDLSDFNSILQIQNILNTFDDIKIIKIDGYY